MLRFVGFGLLLSACLLLHGCHGKDAVYELEKYLSTNVKSSDSTLNIEDFQMLSSMSTELTKNSKLRDLVGQISDLRLTDDSQFCEGPNLERLRNVSAVVFANKSKKPVLTKLLGGYIDKAKSKCLEQLELQVQHEAEYLMNRYYMLKHLDLLFFDLAKRRISVVGRDLDLLTYLYGAKKFVAGGHLSSPRLKVVLKNMVCANYEQDPMPCGLKLNAKTGEEEKLATEQAQSHFERALLEPCKEFLEDDKIQPILKRAAYLGEAMLSKDSLQHLDQNYYHLTWASRPMVCKWFISRDVRKIAKQLSGNPKTKKYLLNDPVSMLNSYLVDHLVFNWDWNANIRKLREMRPGSDRVLDSEKVSELVQVILKLRPMGDDDEEFCGGPNLKNLRTTAETVNGYDEGSFIEPLRNRRLNFILAHYAKQAYEKCLKTKLEPQFSKFELETSKQYWPLKKLLDPICLFGLNFKPKFIPGQTYLNHLVGAMNLPQEVKPLSPIESELTSLVRGIDDQSGGSAKDRVNRHLFKPCRDFLADEPVQDILARVVDLGATSDITNARVNLLYEYYTLKWAPITVACKWITKKGVNEFAGMI